MAIDWRPVVDAPRDGRFLLMRPAPGSASIPFLGRWVEKFSIPHYGDAAPGWYAEGYDCRAQPTEFCDIGL